MAFELIPPHAGLQIQSAPLACSPLFHPTSMSDNTTMPDPIGVADAAKALGLPSTKALSDAFYAGKLDKDRCPVISGRRVIPRSYLPAIAIELRRMGHNVSYTG